MFVHPEHEEIGLRTFLDGRKVRKRFGDEVRIVDGDGLLHKTYTPLAFFFGAKWDGNSEKFLPFLRNFCDRMKEKGNNFDVIYVSSDNSVEEFEEFMQELPEDCIALYSKYYDGNDAESQLGWFFRERYYIKRIPKMFIEFGAHPVFKPVNKSPLLDYGIYPGMDPYALTDIMEFGEKAWDRWRPPRLRRLKVTEDIEPYEKSSSFYEADYRLNKYFLRTEYCYITRHPVWQPTKSPLEMFSDLTLLRKLGDELIDTDAKEALEDIDIVGLYFSGEDCETCHTTIRYLPKCYRKWKGNVESFEIIYLSVDKSKEVMENYMKLMHGDWLAVPFEEDWETRFGGNIYFPNYPTLIIVKKTGEIITSSGGLDISVKEVTAMDYWKQGKPAVTYEESIESDVKWKKEVGLETWKEVYADQLSGKKSKAHEEEEEEEEEEEKKEKEAEEEK